MQKTLIASVSIVAMVAVAAVVYYNFFYILPVPAVASQVMTEGTGTDEVQIAIIDLPMSEKGKFDEVVTENSDVVKLTHSDGSGWSLKKGETLSFSYKLT